MSDLDDRLSLLADRLRTNDAVSRGELDRRMRKARRRRRLSVGSIVALVLVALVAGVMSLRDPGHARSVRVVGPTPPHARASQSSVALPSTPLYQQVAVVDGHVQLSGGFGNSPGCSSTVVDATTLRLGQVSRSNCNDPATQGVRVGIVNAYVPKSNTATIRVARTERRRDGFSVGPVVMTYASLSDTKPVSTTAGSWLWIYDVDTTNGPELLQVSAASGVVVNTVHMPTIYRPVMAANDDGLWLGPSVNETIPPVATVYHVSPGSAHVTVALGGHDWVCWLVANGHDLWAGTGPTCVQQTIRRFRGSDSRLVFAVADHGVEPNTVIGNETDGLWTMQWVPPPSAAGRLAVQLPQEIVGIDPDTGTEHVVAHLPKTPFTTETDESEGLVAGQAVYFHDSLYLLEPPYQPGADLGYSTLRRVALSN